MVKTAILMLIVSAIMIFLKALYNTLFFSKTAPFVTVVSHEVSGDSVTFQKGNLLNNILIKKEQ